MPVPTQRKESRRALINAGQPVAQFLRFNTSSRKEVASGLDRLMTPTYASGLPVRSQVSKDTYRYFLQGIREARGFRYQFAQLGGERNAFKH